MSQYYPSMVVQRRATLNVTELAKSFIYLWTLLRYTDTSPVSYFTWERNVMSMNIIDTHNCGYFKGILTFPNNCCCKCVYTTLYPLILRPGYVQPGTAYHIYHQTEDKMLSTKHRHYPKGGRYLADDLSDCYIIWSGI